MVVDVRWRRRRSQHSGRYSNAVRTERPGELSPFDLDSGCMERPPLLSFRISPEGLFCHTVRMSQIFTCRCELSPEVVEDRGVYKDVGRPVRRERQEREETETIPPATSSPSCSRILGAMFLEDGQHPVQRAQIGPPRGLDGLTRQRQTYEDVICEKVEQHLELSLHRPSLARRETFQKPGRGRQGCGSLWYFLLFLLVLGQGKGRITPRVDERGPCTEKDQPATRRSA